MRNSKRGLAYEVQYDSEAASFIEKLPLSISSRILAKVDKARSDPLHYFKHLKARKTYSLRVGKYRVVADIDQKRRIIQVLLVGHRKNVYR